MPCSLLELTVKCFENVPHMNSPLNFNLYLIVSLNWLHPKWKSTKSKQGEVVS